MSGEALGGGVMVAISAALWVAYLMPTWSRRREYLATERNAIRLQQTLRILAETAAVPQQVHLEANARTVATQRKLLAQAEHEALAEAKATEDAARAARRAAAAQRAAAAAQAAAHARQLEAQVPAVATLRRVRRGRALSSLLFLAGVFLLFTGIAPMVEAGAPAGFGFGVAVIAASLAALSRLAKTARSARVVRITPAVASVPTRRFEPVQFEETPAEKQQTWTPQPLPRPLYLSRGTIAQTAMASVDAAAELRRAAAESELARRAAAIAASQAPDVTPIARPAARAAASASPSAPPSRFASMGIVGDTAPGISDLDAVLRRRRAAG